MQGAGRLTVDAVVGITDIVEAMHHTIVSFGGKLGNPAQKRTRGIPGLVYKSIRSITELAGVGLDISLRELSSILDESESSPGREAILSAVNGVLGDYLAARSNPLAISMRFRNKGKSVTAEELAETIRQSNGKVIIMVHGLCMNDLQWNRKGHDHGSALSRDCGFTPIYLHYNTGRHTSENGRQFADLLEDLSAQFKQPTELCIVAHSMGGLVSRSACHYGKISGHTWLKHLRKIVFLGTPHHGALLERGGNWLDTLLQISPYSAPFGRLGKIRSSGITDLRYGNVADEDWQEQDRFTLSADHRTAVPLPEGVQCYCIAGTRSREKGKLGDNVIGDGLVTVNSALGRHRNPRLQLLFPKSHQWVGRKVNHLDLLNHPEVYEILKKWVTR